MPRITNAIILNEIKHIQKDIESINQYLEKQNSKIADHEKEIKKNSIAIASIKGITVGVSAVITFIINFVLAYFSVNKT